MNDTNDIKTIEQVVDVELSQLGPNLKQCIYEKLKSKLENSCDKDYGYIFQIGKNIKILPDNIVSTAGPNVFFRVALTISAFKPEQGRTYTGKVCQVLAIGILVEVRNILKIFVSTKNIIGYTFDKSVFRKGSQTIGLNDMVNVQINMIRYENQKFSCLGSLN